MVIKDVMSIKVKSVAASTPYRAIWLTIFKSHTNAVPVVDTKGRLVGLVTRDDLLRAVYPKYQEVFEEIETPENLEALEDRMKELGGVKASDVMQKKVIFTRDRTLVMRALSRMIVRRVNQLPVLNEKDVVIGMVTKGDIFTSLFRKNFTQSASSGSKQKIKKKHRLSHTKKS